MSVLVVRERPRWAVSESDTPSPSALEEWRLKRIRRPVRPEARPRLTPCAATAPVSTAHHWRITTKMAGPAIFHRYRRRSLLSAGSGHYLTADAVERKTILTRRNRAPGVRPGAA